MSEFFPIASGALLGLVTLRIFNLQLRVMTQMVFSILIGLMASYISSELFISWDFVYIDIPLVFLSAIAVTTAGEKYQQWLLYHRGSSISHK